MMTVVKLGGNSMDELPALLKFVGDIEGQVVLVHGGAPQITAMMKRLGLEGTFHKGLRITDEATLEVSQMVLTGQVNKQIVVAAQQMGLPAVGLSGVDGGLLQADLHLDGQLGRVGAVREVQVKLLHTLLDQSFIPIVSPLGLGPDGGVLNINADMSAAAIAAGLKADRLVFLTNVDGLLDEDGKTIPSVTPDGVKELLHTGVITKGMIPKIESALSALAGGVQQVEIRNASHGQGTTLKGESNVETIR
jgi:acetylglutamate kinase